MFDEDFVTALAVQIAARINPQLQRRNRNPTTRLLTFKDAAEYIGMTRRRSSVIDKNNAGSAPGCRI